jgi:hypothetical protein
MHSQHYDGLQPGCSAAAAYHSEQLLPNPAALQRRSCLYYKEGWRNFGSTRSHMMLLILIEPRLRHEAHEADEADAAGTNMNLNPSITQPPGVHHPAHVMSQVPGALHNYTPIQAAGACPLHSTAVSLCFTFVSIAHVCKHERCISHTAQLCTKVMMCRPLSSLVDLGQRRGMGMQTQTANSYEVTSL